MKFYVHHGIWLPAFCYHFAFQRYPDMNSVFDNDGAHTRSSFRIQRKNVQALVSSIGPQSIWMKYSEQDSTLRDSTLQCPCTLPLEAVGHRPSIMLYSSDTKGDYYNIWISPDTFGIVEVTISMPFT